MGKHKLNDQEMEELLRKLPKLEDYRAKEEIYSRVASRVHRRKRPLWVMPSLASAAIAVVFFILAPAMTGEHGAFDQESSEKSETFDHAKNEIGNDSQDHSLMMQKDEEGNKGAPSAVFNAAAYEPVSVYPDDLSHYDPITYSIPDQNANTLVPVTVLVEKGEEQNWFSQFKDTMVELKEEAWGLMEYFPLYAEMTYDQSSRTVHVDLPSSHPYANGSASETLFLRTLQESFPADEVEKVYFSTEGAKGIQLGNHGETFEMEIDDKIRRAYLFLYPNTDNKPYMVPTVDQVSSFEEALDKMAMPDPETGLSASIPSGIDVDAIEVEEADGILELVIEKPIETSDQFLYSLEAILLTAKSFGYEKIKMDIPGVNMLGPFDLSQAVTVPVGPNKKILAKGE